MTKFVISKSFSIFNPLNNNHMNELTMEERAKVFMSYGLLKEVATPNGNLKVTSYHIDSLVTLGGKPWSYKECQLILTPLSDITDEDVIEVAKIIMRRHNRHYKDGEVVYKVETEKLNGCPTVGIYVQGRTKGSYSIRIEPDAVCLMKHKDSLLSSGQCFHVPNQYEAADFLRSRSYHLPYKNIDLYEAGIAVKPNKTNSNE